MTLARAWTRQLYGASFAALLVPGSVVAALLVLAFAGGFGRFAILGQAFSGPSTPLVAGARAAGSPLRLGHLLSGGAAGPGSAPIPATGAGGPGRAANVRSSAAAAIGSGAQASHFTGVPGGAGDAGGAGGAPGGGAPGGSAGGSHSHGSQGGFGGHRPRTGPSSPSSPALFPLTLPQLTPASAPPTVVDGVVKLGTSVTRALPGVVGDLGTQVVTTLGNVGDSLLPLRLGDILASPVSSLPGDGVACSPPGYVPPTSPPGAAPPCGAPGAAPGSSPSPAQTP